MRLDESLSGDAMDHGSLGLDPWVSGSSAPGFGCLPPRAPSGRWRGVEGGPSDNPRTRETRKSLSSILKMLTEPESH